MRDVIVHTALECDAIANIYVVGEIVLRAKIHCFIKFKIDSLKTFVAIIVITEITLV